jgi:hypothetical protein
MTELSEICRAARRAAAEGEALWLATVMRVRFGLQARRRAASVHERSGFGWFRQRRLLGG